MKHIKATDKTLVVKQVELEANKKTNSLIVTSTKQQEVSFGEVIDSKSEQYPIGTIVIFRHGIGLCFTLNKVEYIIFNVEQVIATVFDDKPPIKRKLSLVSNNADFIQSVNDKWTKTGIYNDNMMEIDSATLYVLLENEFKYIEEQSELSPFLYPLLFPLITRVYSNNTLIQATQTPTFYFENEEKTHDNLKVVTSINLKTSMNMSAYSRLDNKYYEKVVERLTKEIDELGECVIYTPLVANKVMSPLTFEDEYRFVVRIWKERR